MVISSIETIVFTKVNKQKKEQLKLEMTCNNTIYQRNKQNPISKLQLTIIQIYHQTQILYS